MIPYSIEVTLWTVALVKCTYMPYPVLSRLYACGPTELLLPVIFYLSLTHLFCFVRTCLLGLTVLFFIIGNWSIKYLLYSPRHTQITLVLLLSLLLLSITIAPFFFCIFATLWRFPHSFLLQVQLLGQYIYCSMY